MNITVENEPNQSNESTPDSSDKEFDKAPKTKLQYQVQHGIFKWTIENFSDFPQRHDKYCRSPIFILKHTSWNLALHPKSRNCGQDKIALNVIRNSSDLGPTIVIVSFRIGLENAGNKIWFKTNEQKRFGKGDSYGFETSLLGHLEDFLTEGVETNDDSVSVLCEMYILYSLNVDHSLLNDILPTVDLNLWRDLFKMFCSQQYTDVLIEIPRFHFKAHKSVLCARSKILSRLFEDDKSFIQFNCTQSSLYCVLLYIYSGNFNILATRAVFSIGLYELACELSLSTLKEILRPNNVELKSRITIDECKMSCTLYDFQISDISKKTLNTETYFIESSGISVQYCFQTVSVPENRVECRIALSGVGEALDFSLKLFILNKNCDPFKIIPGMLLQNSDAKFRNSVFYCSFAFSTENVLSCLSDGNLVINFQCKRCSLKHLSEPAVDINTELQIPFYDPNIWLGDLSSDLKALYKTGKMSDITLMSQGKFLKAHRCILTARSEYFRKILHNGRKKETKELPNTPFYILEWVCSYIYSGEIDDAYNLTKEDFLDLYEAAEDYVIKSLIEECEEYLTVNLDPDFVYDIMPVAQKYKNSSLTLMCINYIASLGIDSNSSEESMAEIEE